MNRFIIGFFSLISLLIFTHCKKSKSRLPLVTTSNFEVKLVSAKIAGVLYEEGDAKVIEKGICWGVKAGVSTANNKVTSVVNEKAFKVEIDDLAYGTTYFARAYAISELGVSYGKEISFTTWSNELPNLVLSTPTQPSATSIDVSLQLNQETKATYTAGICWSTNPMPSVLNNTISVAERFHNDVVPLPFTDSYIKTLQNLNENTMYYFRAFATNGLSIIYSQQLSIQTASPINIVSLNFLAINDAKITCQISNINISEIAAVGICWSTSPLPTTSNGKLEQAYSGNTYTGLLTSLNPATAYYVRAYVKVSNRNIYSSQVVIKTYKDIVTDIDGNTYYTVEIGNKEWMASNLRTSRYNNGATMQYVANYNQWVNSVNAQVPVYCYYADQSSNNAIYGKLYPRYVATDQNIAPVGWHVATVEEWETLFATNPMYDLWNTTLGFMGNITRLSLSAGGKWDAGYGDLSQKGYFWASEGTASKNSFVVTGSSNLATWHSNGKGLSIRCVKD